MKAKFLKLLSIMAVLSLLAMSNNLFAQWAKNAVSGTSGNYGYGVAVDGSGNSYIVGRFAGTADFDPSASTANLTAGGSSDIYLAKYDVNGAYQWAINIGNTSYNYGYGVALDGSGGVYITGHFKGTDVDFDPGAGTTLLTSAGEYDVFFAKYSTVGGSLVWAKSVGGAETEYAYGIEVVGGAVYIVGRFQGTSEDFDPGAGTAILSSGSSSRYDVFFAKYNATDGSYQWAKNIGNSSDTEYGYDLAVSSEYIHIIGYFTNTVDFDPDGGTTNLTSAGSRDVFFAKYKNTDGSLVWARNVGGSGGNDDYGYGIDIDASDNVYITGRFEGSGDYDPGAGTATLASNGGYDTFFAKYNSSGVYLWAQAVGGTDAVYGYNIISNGTNVYVAGKYKSTADFSTNGGNAISLTSAGNYDVWFAKYAASDGASSWAKSVGGTDIDQIEYGNSISTGSFHITGFFNSTDADFDPDAGTITLASAGNFDIFNAKYDNSGATPVELTSFTAEGADGGVLLSWQTATEVNNYGFEVEASDDNVNWTKIDFVEGHGNSNAPQNYSLVVSVAMYYRLKQIDTDGSFEYSNVVEVNGNLPKEVVLNQNHPNPFNPSTVISYSIPKMSNVSIIVYNALGQEVANLINKSQNAGTYSVEFDASELTSGIYIYTLQSAGVLQSKKMLLIK